MSIVMQRNFALSETVCPHIYARWGESSWKFVDERLQATMDVVRNEILCVPLIVNTYAYGGLFRERGVRCNICAEIQKYTTKNLTYQSAHLFGKGIDFSSTKMTADEMRAKIIEMQDKLPYKIRLEDKSIAPTWVHLDVLVDPTQKEKVYVFR